MLRYIDMLLLTLLPLLRFDAICARYHFAPAYHMLLRLNVEITGTSRRDMARGAIMARYAVDDER